MITIAVPRRSLNNRRAALAVSVVLHVGLIALLFVGSTDRARQRPQRGVNIVAVMADRDTRAQPRKLAEKPKVDVTPLPGETLFPVDMPLLAQDAMSSALDGEECAIAATIQADLLADEAARAELGAIPFDSRSVANAIVLWTGPEELVRPDLPQVDALIQRRLETVQASCLDLEQTGPDLIYTTVDARTVSIAIGSGRWRWRDFANFLNLTMRPIAPAERISPALDY